MSGSTSLLIAVIGLLGVAVGAVLNQAVAWRRESRQNTFGSVRILSLLRETRYYADRAKNEIEHHDTIGDYAEGWAGAVNTLRECLDAGNNKLTGNAVAAAYTAAVACKDTIFASEHHFARDLLKERINRTITQIERAQHAIGDPDPTVYFREV